jgi:hypothetical protein
MAWQPYYRRVKDPTLQSSSKILKPTFLVWRKSGNIFLNLLCQATRHIFVPSDELAFATSILANLRTYCLARWHSTFIGVSHGRSRCALERAE